MSHTGTICASYNMYYEVKYSYNTISFEVQTPDTALELTNLEPDTTVHFAVRAIFVCEVRHVGEWAFAKEATDPGI